TILSETNSHLYLSHCTYLYLVSFTSRLMFLLSGSLLDQKPFCGRGEMTSSASLKKAAHHRKVLFDIMIFLNLLMNSRLSMAPGGLMVASYLFLIYLTNGSVGSLVQMKTRRYSKDPRASS